MKLPSIAVPAVAVIAAPPASAQLSVRPPPISTYDGDSGRLGDPATWRTPSSTATSAWP